MKTLLLSLIIGIIFIPFFASCNLLETLKGSGKIIEKDLPVNAFSAIENNGIFDMVITQDSSLKIKVVTDENIHQHLIFKQQGETLIFSNNDNVMLQPTKAIIYISASMLKSIASSGTGDVNLGPFISNDGVILNNTGTSDICLSNFEGTSLEINNNGTGDVKLSGKIQNLLLDNSGTGDIWADKMSANKAKVENSGTGDIIIIADEELSIDNSGTGDVTYTCNSNNIKINSSGTGDVIKK